MDTGVEATAGRVARCAPAERGAGEGSATEGARRVGDPNAGREGPSVLCPYPVTQAIRGSDGVSAGLDRAAPCGRRHYIGGHARCDYGQLLERAYALVVASPTGFADNWNVSLDAMTPSRAA